MSLWIKSDGNGGFKVPWYVVGAAIAMLIAHGINLSTILDTKAAVDKLISKEDAVVARVTALETAVKIHHPVTMGVLDVVP
jgi:hypothetical protein